MEEPGVHKSFPCILPIYRLNSLEGGNDRDRSQIDRIDETGGMSRMKQILLITDGCSNVGTSPVLADSQARWTHRPQPTNRQHNRNSRIQRTCIQSREQT